MGTLTSFMQQALAQAERAFSAGEVPVGAIVTRAGKVIARAGNKIVAPFDPTGHAEIRVLRQACARLKTTHLTDCDLYVTLEPCPMCAQAIAWAQVRRLYFGAYDPKSGGVEHGPRIFTHASCHHQPEVVGGCEEALCRAVLVRFFSSKRATGLP
ncbi:MAG: nucleoside deaminase [Holosporales bacterium]|nr:nucleoside deaminase [Holosporales bacterium]